MFKKFYEKVRNFIKEEYKFIIFLAVFYIIFSWPVNYYIVTGGGTSDIDSRIKIDNSYNSKGSFNISYVVELKGSVGNYLISYVMPDWKRVSMNDYKLDDKEDYDDIEFRSNLDLKEANANAVRIAYQLANKKYEVVETKIYVTGTFEEYKSDFKIQDQIIAINNHSFNTVNEYRDYIQTLDKNTSVNVEVLRKKKKKIIKASLYESNNRKILGVALQEVSKYKTDPKITIKFKNDESGPSAGLITTLDIYNKLTKKDLTKSLKIAGTGTVEDDGSVGEIGEVKYKLLGAVKDKADIFLVPSGSNYKTCMKLKKERKLKIKIIEVHNVEEAIKKLEEL